MINQIATRKAIAFIEENINKAIQQAIVYQNYTHICNSFEIVLLKKFKANILDDF